MIIIIIIIIAFLLLSYTNNNNNNHYYYIIYYNFIIVASTNNQRKLYRNVRNSERVTRSVERASLTRDASEPDRWSVQEKKSSTMMPI